MPRELESYRDIIEDVLKFTGGKRLLTTKDVAAYLGICYNTARSRFGITKDGITAQSLARKLAKLSS